MNSTERLELIKTICQKKKTNKNVSFSEFTRALSEKESVATVGIENSPHIDWRKELDPIDEEIQSQIFG
jgi:hypothetical protein